MNPLLVVASALFAMCALPSSVQGAALGAEGWIVPPLACFGDAPVETFDMSVVVSDLSGVTFDPETATFFVVNNGDAIAYEIALPNTLLGRWNLKDAGITDPESISSMGSRKFAITVRPPGR